MKGWSSVDDTPQLGDREPKNLHRHDSKGNGRFRTFCIECLLEVMAVLIKQLALLAQNPTSVCTYFGYKYA